MIKTVELTGSEIEVSDLGGQNVAVKNLGDGSIYASPYPNVVAGADNVVEIPAGSGEVVLDANGTLYLIGTGKAQCTGTSYATPNFKMPSSSQSGGGGGKSQDVICGAAEYASGGIKSIPVEVSGSIEESFAAALAAETGWELQPDGVSVLKDDEVGFRFINTSHRFVALVNNVINGDSNYIDNFQYLENTGSSYYMDVCYSPNGAVAFGFRLENETPKLTFMMTKDGNGDSVCMATYYHNMRLEWCKKGDTSGRVVIDGTLRAIGEGVSVLGLFKFADEYSGGTFEDCYCVYLIWPHYPSLYPGNVVSINNRRFAIIFNHIYDDAGQIWLAMPVAEQ